MVERGENPKESESWFPYLPLSGHGKGRAGYTEARDIVFNEDINASAYRVLLAGVPHVIVVGDGPLVPSLRQRFEQACASGEPVELPPDVAQQLIERRVAGRIPGVFWERRSL